MSEILGIIARSPAETASVFEAIAASAAKVCRAVDAAIFLVDGELLRLVAHVGDIPPGPVGQLTLPLDRGTVGGRSVVDRSVIHIADLTRMADDYPEGAAHARLRGHRTILSVPLMRGEMAIGAVHLRRRQARPFSEEQISTLRAFADQAVIAIENARLFTELKESLDQQTATSEILRAISQSQMDATPVFEAIVHSAVRLLGGYAGSLTRVVGDQIELAAFNEPPDSDADAGLRSLFPVPLDGVNSHAAAIRNRAPLNTVDAQTDPEWPDFAREAARRRGYRSLIVVPLLRHGDALGALAVNRREAGGFSDDEIALLQTFADQAVIAIENVRLFTELQSSNRELTTALDQQTATSEILRVISGSPTDVQPVFETIITNAVRLCGAFNGALYRVYGESLHVGAACDMSGPVWERWLTTFPRPLRDGAALSEAVETGRVLNVPDVERYPTFTPAARELFAASGIRSALFVPMRRHEEVIGVIAVTHREIDAFTDAKVQLLQTFADQAVIAIENVRLFTELQSSTKELTRSVGELKALGEIGRAVGSSLDLDTVLRTIVGRAIELAEGDGGTIYEADEAGERFTLRVTTNVDEESANLQRKVPLRRGEGAIGRAAVARAPVQIADTTVEGAYGGPLRDRALRRGTRALLAVPLVHEDRVVGGLVVSRNTPGEFAPAVVDLMTAFATQSALAIQNARLFQEIEVKSRQLEVASQHKSEFLANMSHELRTPLNAVIGFSEVLKDRMFGDINDKQEEYLGDILSSAQHLLSLINDILDLSKIEAGRMELDPSEFDLPAALDDALLLVRERASRRGIALERVMDERLGIIRADQRKVKQVVLNLLSNALKFTPEGGSVTVRAAVVDGFAEVSVIDTGVGIAPEDHGAVFEEFRQVGANDKKSEGTGLGLPLTKKFVELHGGQIWLKSAIGEGATFTFTLPLLP
jgi:signal transduction histidine kinase